jgi:hypothetical protein
MGIDDYDHYPKAMTREAFLARATANGGIHWLAAHARRHNKQILVPEWGIAPGSGAHGGGDNANYIEWMFETFKGWHSEGLLAGEFYFADSIGNGNVDSDLIGGNPKSRERYVSLWRAKPPPDPDGNPGVESSRTLAAAYRPASRQPAHSRSRVRRAKSAETTGGGLVSRA